MKGAKSNKRVVVIGGGTGSYTLLSDLKKHTPNITALVNMADDGGSTGVLRDEFGVLPPGDVRQCLAALSQSSAALRELFNYRFPEGSTFAGHSFGNLFLSAVEMMTKDFGEAVKLASTVLNITGRVVPITLDNCHLTLTSDDKQVSGEHEISKQDFDGKKAVLSLSPPAAINPVATEAVAEADLIVIAPGNLYGSLAPVLLAQGLTTALASVSVPIVYVCNLVNKPVQTKGYDVSDYASEIERFIGKPLLTHVLYNTNQPTPEVLQAYALEGEYPVNVNSTKLDKAHYQAIGGNFLSRASQQRNENDTFILRSLIRHDAEAIASQLMELT